MEHSADQYYSRALKLHNEGYSVKTIHHMLMKEGLKEDLLVEAMCRIKLLVYKKRKSRGVNMMVAGGILLLIGFAMTVMMFHQNANFDMVMYGFTILGTLLMGYGAYEVLQ